MRILTLSLNAWNNTKATGNTFSNFFADFGNYDVEFANIFCRNEDVDNHICNRYYKITEKDIIRNLIFIHHKSGNLYEPLTQIQKNNSSKSKSKLGSSLKNWITHTCRPAVLLFAREILWKLGRWKSRELKQFMIDFKPDIIYMHGHNNIYMHQLLWFCQQITGAKIVLFFGDDMYGYKSKHILQRLYDYWLRKTLSKSISKASLLLGGSNELCEEYSAIFKKKFYPQFKTVDLLTNKFKEFNSPFSIVYAGNLLYGRDEMLIKIAESIRNFNFENGKIFELNVYSNSDISKKQISKLNDGVSTFYHGAVSYSEICHILNKCDISLFIESFRKKDILSTRLSFSTKIIDYIQSSSALLIVGPKSISSVKYLVNSGAGIYAEEYEKFDDVLKLIFIKPELLYQSASRKRELAMKNHSKHVLLERMQTLLYSD